MVTEVLVDSEAVTVNPDDSTVDPNLGKVVRIQLPTPLPGAPFMS